MARKLKVFQAQLGFYDTVVAAPSQAAALRAWGTHLNLFADGMAKPATDDDAIAAALAQPEVPLRRAVGTKDSFSLKAGTPRLPEEAKKQAAARAAPIAKNPPAPDRSALDATEARLRAVDKDWKREETVLQEREKALSAEEHSLRQRRAEFDEDAAGAKARHDERHAEAEASVAREQRNFEKLRLDQKR